VASVDYVVKGLASLTDTDSLLREIASGMLAKTHTRIHNYGERADGTPIGTYSDAYMKLRTDSYSTNYYTKGKNKGQPRPLYKRDFDTKVIFSLTRQMEKDYSIIAISDTEYGLGFQNPVDGQKSVWLQEQFGNNIWALSEEELSDVEAIIQEFVNNAFK